MPVNLTIIIPHYNLPGYLGDLLDSIPRLDDVQVIVVDDRSTVRLGEYEALKSKYPHVTFARNDGPGKGAGAARNQGLRLAEGRWLMFADSDDTFSPGFYEAVSARFDSDADIVFFPPTSVDGLTGKTGIRHEYYQGLIRGYLSGKTRAAELSMRYMWNAPWSKLIRRELVEANNIAFDETPIENDTMFSTKAGHCAKRLEVAEETVYRCLFRMESTSAALSESKITVRLGVFIDKYLFLKQRLTRDDLSRLPIHPIIYLGVQAVNGYPVKSAVKMLGVFRGSGMSLWHKGALSASFLISGISRVFRKILYRRTHAARCKSDQL